MSLLKPTIKMWRNRLSTRSDAEKTERNVVDLTIGWGVVGVAMYFWLSALNVKTFDIDFYLASSPIDAKYLSYKTEKMSPEMSACFVPAIRELLLTSADKRETATVYQATELIRHCKSITSSPSKDQRKLAENLKSD